MAFEAITSRIFVSHCHDSYAIILCNGSCIAIFFYGEILVRRDQSYSNYSDETVKVFFVFFFFSRITKHLKINGFLYFQ